MMKAFCAVGVFVVFTMMTIPQALAGDTPCLPNLGAVTIGGNVVVDGVCTLNGTTVDGSVKLKAGASLLATSAIIKGSVQDEESGVERVRLSFTDVDGDVQLEEVAGARVSRIVDSAVGGSVQLEFNSAAFVVKDNDIGSDLQANNNTGGIEITGKDIDGNLQCQDNDPAPTGGGNTVGGSAENQCEGLS